MSGISERSKNASKNSGDAVAGEKSPSRRDILLTSTALVAATALGAALGPTTAELRTNPRRPRGRSRTSS